MERIYKFKDGSNRIALGDVTYRPIDLEKILNLESAFYAGTAMDGENKIDDIENPISEWFNYKGLTYIKE